MSEREFSRTDRVAEQIQRELAEILTRDVSDPRFQAVTVSGVRISRDFAHAKVFVTLRSGTDVQATLQALKKATGYLSRHLAQRMHIRSMPRLSFAHDQSLDTAMRIDELLARESRRDADDTGDA